MLGNFLSVNSYNDYSIFIYIIIYMDLLYCYKIVIIMNRVIITLTKNTRSGTWMTSLVPSRTQIIASYCCFVYG